MIPCGIYGGIPIDFEENNEGKSKKTDSSLAAIDSILAAHPDLPDLVQAEWLCEKAQLYQAENYHSTAIELYDRALELLENQPCVEKKMDIILQVADLYEHAGNYSAGMEKLYLLLKLAGQAYPLQKASAYILLGHYYTLLHNTPLAKEHLDSAAHCLNLEATPQNDTTDELQYKLHNAYAEFQFHHNMDSAFVHLRLAEHYAKRDIHKISVIYQNTAVLYSYLSDYEKADTYFKKALLLIEDEFKKLYVSYNIAELEIWKGNRDYALSLFEDVYDKAVALPSYPVQVESLKAMADIYAQRRDFEKSYRLLLQAQAVSDSSMLSEDRKNILMILRDFESFKAENEKRIYNYRTEVNRLQTFKKNVLIGLFAIGLATALVAIAILYRKFRKANRHSSHLSTLLSDKITEDKNIIRDIQDEADRRSRELVSASLAMAQISDTISDILQQLSSLRRHTDDPKGTAIISSIENQINSLNISKKQWETFKLYFEQVHPSFFRNLNRAYPTLTTNENQICSFIIMNFNTKDIAAMTNRSPRTIDTIKFRIRRKMNIPKEVSTFSFLMNFTKDEPTGAETTNATT